MGIEDRHKKERKQQAARHAAELAAHADNRANALAELMARTKGKSYSMAARNAHAIGCATVRVMATDETAALEYMRNNDLDPTFTSGYGLPIAEAE
jgi:hypothetical protein